jgi:hypothetical protein
LLPFATPVTGGVAGSAAAGEGVGGRVAAGVGLAAGTALAAGVEVAVEVPLFFFDWVAKVCLSFFWVCCGLVSHDKVVAGWGRAASMAPRWHRRVARPSHYR